MKILVTGATGFIGSRLIQYLDKKNHSVWGLSRHRSIDTITNIQLLDFQQLNNFFKDKKFDVIVHLAALIDEQDPIQMFTNNCIATANLLECCRLHGINKFIFTSTHAVYGSTKYMPIDEIHPLNPSTNYAISKTIAENLCKMFFISYGIQIIILRISSVYGEGQSMKKMIPSMIQHCMTDKKLVLHKYANGFQVMDLIHVKDVCKAIETACISQIKFGTYNISSGKSITVSDISKILKVIFKNVKISIKKIPHDTNHFLYDISNTKKDLKFTSSVPFNVKTLQLLIRDIKKENKSNHS